jgi:IS30 family transposase
MELKIVPGRNGGLPGSASPRVPGENGPGEPVRQRRPLTSEDRSVIAAGLTIKLSYAQIGELIGRDKSVVRRAVARNRSRKAPTGRR